MKNYNAHHQQGAVLVIALVMLLVITVLAVSSMRGVTLESRITANRVQSQHLQNLADAALREGEMRLYGPGLDFKLKDASSFKANCTKSNKLNRHGHNKLCLLEMSDTDFKSFYEEPIQFLTDYAGYDEVTGKGANSAGDNDILAWMPYRGLDSDEKHYFESDDSINTYWNSYFISPELCGEIEDALTGKGTLCFLVTGQANDEIAVQSTITVINL